MRTKGTILLAVCALLGVMPGATLAGYWEGPFSDGSNNEGYCQHGIFGGFSCYGDYCDNLWMWCEEDYTFTAQSPWGTTGLVSEEQNLAECKAGGALAPIRLILCFHDYCDDKAFYCDQRMQNEQPWVIQYDTCETTDWISDDISAGGRYWPGFDAVGAECDGSYCDNIRFKVCSDLYP